MDKDKNNKEKQFNDSLNNFLNPDEKNMDCSSGTCVIKNDKSIVERINKKIITEDGRQLLL